LWLILALSSRLDLLMYNMTCIVVKGIPLPPCAPVQQGQGGAADPAAPVVQAPLVWKYGRHPIYGR